jgi:hypothetical protein
VGKSALLEFIEPALRGLGTPVWTTRITPFGAFIREIYTGLWEAGLVPDGTADFSADWKAFGKAHPSNDEKIGKLIRLMADHQGKIIVVIDEIAKKLILWILGVIVDGASHSLLRSALKDALEGLNLLWGPGHLGRREKAVGCRRGIHGRTPYGKVMIYSVPPFLGFPFGDARATPFKPGSK